MSESEHHLEAARKMGETSTLPSVVIACDRPLLRQALTEALLAHRITVLGEGAEGPHAIAMAERYKPDVLVVDLEMWGAWLVEEMEKLRELSPNTQVVGVTRIDSHKQARDLLGAGASAYLGRSATMEELLLAIRTAMEPEKKDASMMVVSKRAVNLSEREVDILSGAARGLTNRELASRLHIAEATVKRHLANVYEKMEVHSRTEAILKAIQEGWITIWDILAEKNLEEEQGPGDEG
ncbi:MAG: response regulator transcription factor [Rubrobacteraceae bacterium]|nr:response regulator transcription factor [Rubrobacteraceae bacterium]